MTFSSEPPSGSGFYAWQREDGQVGCINFARAPHRLAIKAMGEMGLKWCRLVPDYEIGKAWLEASACYRPGDIQPDFELSRAKRVMDGKHRVAQ